MADCEPPHFVSLSPSASSDSIIYYTVEQAELSVLFNFDIVPSVCSNMTPILTVAPLSPAIALNPTEDAVNVLTYDQLQSVDS